MTYNFDYTEEEIALLKEHDKGETLHAYEPKRDRNGEEGPEQSWLDYDSCRECGDTEEGLMHNNTWRNVEPLMEGN